MENRPPQFAQALRDEREGLQARLESGEGDPEMLKRRIGEIGDQLGEKPKRAGRAAAEKESRPG